MMESPVKWAAQLSARPTDGSTQLPGNWALQSMQMHGSAVLPSTARCALGDHGHRQPSQTAIRVIITGLGHRLSARAGARSTVRIVLWLTP